jgi:hypothetical protein
MEMYLWIRARGRTCGPEATLAVATALERPKNTEAHLFQVGFTLFPAAAGMFDGRIIFDGFTTAKNFVIGYYGVGRAPVKLNSSVNYPQDKPQNSPYLARLWIS